MQKALTIILLLFISVVLEAQTWQYTSPNIGYFNYAGNKVGIGTASPQKHLHVSGSGVSGVELMLECTDDWYSMMDFKGNGKIWQWGKRPGFEGDAFKLFYLAGNGAQWQGPYMTVYPNGGVGIGTDKVNDAGYKLFVETGIRTRKVTVDQVNPWPDYVFHPGYSLPSLPSLAAYIKLHHHLPDIPSADSVAKDGINLGDNQVQLLKKIEELTLYTIDQQQQLEELKQQNKKMQEQIEMLMKMNKK